MMRCVMIGGSWFNLDGIAAVVRTRDESDDYLLVQLIGGNQVKVDGEEMALLWEALCRQTPVADQHFPDRYSACTTPTNPASSPVN